MFIYNCMKSFVPNFGNLESIKQYSLGPAYNNFDYNEQILCIKIIHFDVKKFSYNTQLLITSSFLCIFLLAVSGSQCV